MNMKTYKKFFESDAPLANSTRGLSSIMKQNDRNVKNITGFSYRISNETNPKDLESPQFSSTNKAVDKKNTSLKIGEIIKFEYKKKKFIGKIDKLLDNIIWLTTVPYKSDNTEFETEEEKDSLKVDLDDIELIKN